jgi:phosphoribosylamine--glycine ligase
VKSGFQLGVRIAVSPFPFDDDATFNSVSKNAAILFKKGIPEEVHIEDVKQIDGQWYVAGTSGVVLIVCGLGQTGSRITTSYTPGAICVRRENAFRCG